MTFDAQSMPTPLRIDGMPPRTLNAAVRRTRGGYTGS